MELTENSQKLSTINIVEYCNEGDLLLPLCLRIVTLKEDPSVFYTDTKRNCKTSGRVKAYYTPISDVI